MHRNLITNQLATSNARLSYKTVNLKFSLVISTGRSRNKEYFMLKHLISNETKAKYFYIHIPNLFQFFKLIPIICNPDPHDRANYQPANLYCHDLQKHVC